MPDITLIEHNDTRHGFEAPAGVSLMQAVTGAGAPGLVAECGGRASCATCHVYIEPPWDSRLPAAAADELACLDFTAAERRSTSRLACQILLDDSLHGLIVRLPEVQR